MALSVDLPLAWRALLAAAGFAFAVSLGEFGATSFLARDDRPTLLWFANQRALEYHPMLVCSRQLDHATHLVLDLDPEYRWAVVGAPSRRLLWVLSRTTSLAEADYAAAVEIARGQGFAVDRLVRTEQSAR